MTWTRRRFIASTGLAAIEPPAFARTRVVTDSAGRRVTVPERVTRILPAGPPASILVFAVAPDALIGWTSAFRSAERPFVPARYADLPVLGRLTGRGNTANLESAHGARRVCLPALTGSRRPWS